MAVKIRLAQRGRKNRITFDVVVANAKAPRDGRFIEKIGIYNPLTDPAGIEIKENRAFHWLMNGAQPSYTVKAILSYRGVMLKKHLQIGVIKGALTQEQADTKLADWLSEKESKIQTKQDEITQTKATLAKKRKETERKIKDQRAEVIRKKGKVETESTSEEILETDKNLKVEATAKEQPKTDEESGVTTPKADINDDSKSKQPEADKKTSPTTPPEMNTSEKPAHSEKTSEKVSENKKSIPKEDSTKP